MFGLLRLLLFLVAGWLILAGVRRLLIPPSIPRRDHEMGTGQKSLPLVQDLQCGRFVVEQEAVRASLRGQTLYFCSHECRDRYLNKEEE
ncbi:MAG: hypothetical protein AB7G75_27475 [Candidatus Binatia bacterium]